MTASPSPAGLSRVVPLGWLMVSVFAKNRALAVVAAPLAVLTLVPYALRGQLYETLQGDGMVIFGRYRLWAEFVIVAVMMSPLLVFYVWLMGEHGPLWAGLFWAGVVAVLLGGVVAMGQGSMSLPAGRETPRGRRWQVAGLAQRPGTRLTALQMTLRLRAALPPGAVLVASAADDDLVRKYQGLGFSVGKQRRVYWVAPSGR